MTASQRKTHSEENRTNKTGCGYERVVATHSVF
jgi:hypothetical protein